MWRVGRARRDDGRGKTFAAKTFSLRLLFDVNVNKRRWRADGAGADITEY
jgi:hypothetical protein